MTIAVYPGSSIPSPMDTLDIAERASRMFRHHYHGGV
jgi:phosphopantetheine adenylyltransferase